ncbi:DUF4179 domain-containing protein [Brevibacillus ruminantium]|uniref:DUF4179 domain-containing protein n=1 Tax=Brevibacillus ruminantium TaxID=2950604 RepID=A0ABY4WN36_9BACL|nr:DUF4179 domain-containing protein [Brevibacillus ruminantium]USG68497.1 DUF4179 domain-containing protein [Brevibacillus ruminantium]
MKSKQLQAYLNDELLPSESVQVERHVEECSFCKSVLEELVQGQEVEELHILGEISPLPDTFTDEITRRLANLPLPALEQRDQQKITVNKSLSWKKRSVDILKKTAIAVAGLAAVITFGSMVSPTFAHYVKSLFHTIDRTDVGIKKAAEDGFSQAVNLKAVDQAITLEVKEVLSDSMRLAILYQITDKDGKPLSKDALHAPTPVPTYDKNSQGDNVKKPEGMEEQESNKVYIKDKDGKDLTLHANWRKSQLGDYILQEIAVSQIRLVDGLEQLPDQFDVQFDYRQIAGTKGKWQVSVPIDLAKAKAVTKDVEVDKKYTSPQGIQLHLQKADFGPSVTRLVWEIQMMADLQKKIQGIIDEKNLMKDPATELLAQQLSDLRFAYEILDDQGSVVAAFDDYTYSGDMGLAKNRVLTNYEKWQIMPSGPQNEVHAFTPMLDKKKVTLKLYSIVMSELADFSTSLKVEDLQKKALEAEYQGSTFVFNGFQSKKIQRGMHQVDGYGIQLQATLPKDIVSVTEWFVRDENGENYPITFVTEDASRDAQGHVKISGDLEIWEMKQAPKQLTLGFRLMDKEYRDVNWEVPIQLSN